MPNDRFFSNAGPFTLEQLAKHTGATLQQSELSDTIINDVAPLHTAQSGQITFLDNVKYAVHLTETKACAIFLRKKFCDKAPADAALLVHDNPYYAYAIAASLFYPDAVDTKLGISPHAHVAQSATIGDNTLVEAGVVIGENVVIGSNCKIGANSVIERGVTIGDNCVFSPNVTVSHAVIGNNVQLFHGVCIGQNGFGYAFHQGVHTPVPQLGCVHIEDFVEVGAGTCIDRGAGPDTIIGAGTKIDNLVQIGHNVKLGKGCIIVAHTGISGSTHLGDYVVVGGQVGIAGHLEIGSGVQIAAQSGVIRSVGDGEVIGGSPAVAIKQFHRQTIALDKLVRSKKKKKKK